MHPVRRQRLFVVLAIVLGSTVGIGLIMFSLSDNLNHFYPPAEIVAGNAPEDRTIRAGGCVVPGSVSRDQSSLKVNFDITDGQVSLPVSHEGILPDLFAEGEATVLVGKLNSGTFYADQVLAKHDETYMPREVADTLAENGESGYKGDHAATCEVIDYGA